MSDQVLIYHPDIPHTKDQPVSRPRKLYEDRMKAKGWRIHPPRESSKESK